MNDYRYTQLEELEQKIQETKSLLGDPAMAELAKEEIAELERQKKKNWKKVLRHHKQKTKRTMTHEISCLK